MSLQESGDRLRETGIIDKIKNALDNNRENLLIVAFVLIIIGGVWAYMQAPQKPDTSSGTAGEIASENEGTGDQDNKPTEAAQAENNTETAPVGAETKTTPAPTKEPEKETASAAPAATNDGQSVSVTAVKGDGLTHVARKALKEYLNGNNETLNSEQKIYIEDFLRKRSSYRNVNPNEVLSYKNDLIKKAIEKSKALTSYQLKNLEKYSKLVKNL